MNSKSEIHVDVVSDVICPWCWVGKRRLEEAMRQNEDKFNFVVRWEPFLLRPEMPEDGVPKPPGFPSASALQHLQDVGKSVGIEFNAKSQRIPWTVPAHTLLEFAKEVDGGSMQNNLQEIIFKGFFTDSLLPDHNNLLKFAAEVGLDVERAKAYIQDKCHQKAVYDRARHWSHQGVTGVPMFYINGQPTFSGAQEVDVFTKMFERVATKFPNQKLQIPANI